jgi:electron transport complex protein RnfB
MGKGVSRMAKEEGIYRDLQKHLNKQAIGYPATKSGVEIRLLGNQGTPYLFLDIVR